MVEEFHVYMLDTGRINVAGLNEASVPILVDAIHAVVTTAPTATA
jgi:aspartate/tyrosine/aromatic aminotransferase